MDFARVGEEYSEWLARTLLAVDARFAPVKEVLQIQTTRSTTSIENANKGINGFNKKSGDDDDKLEDKAGQDRSDAVVVALYPLDHPEDIDLGVVCPNIGFSGGDVIGGGGGGVRCEGGFVLHSPRAFGDCCGALGIRQESPEEDQEGGGEEEDAASTAAAAATATATARATMIMRRSPVVPGVRLATAPSSIGPYRTALEVDARETLAKSKSYFDALTGFSDALAGLGVRPDVDDNKYTHLNIADIIAAHAQIEDTLIA